MTKLCAALSLTIFAGCSFVGGTKDAVTPGGDDEAAPALAGTMAEARTYRRGDVITAPVDCHQSGYAKIDAPVGEPFQIEIAVSAPAEACIGVQYLKANGGTGGPMVEVCSPQSPMTIDVEGLEEGSFLQVAENGVCQGATATFTLK